MLPNRLRLKKNRDFRQVYAQGRSHVSEIAVLYLYRRRDNSQTPRIGFVISKKQGKAVQRNRAKRQMREAVRLLMPQLTQGAFDIIFVGRKGLREAEWTDIQTTIRQLCRRAKILQEPEGSEA